MSHREEASGKTQDTLEKLCLSAGLGTPRGPPGRAGGSVWGEGSLGISAQTAASATRSRTKRMKKMKMKMKKTAIQARGPVCPTLVPKPSPYGLSYCRIGYRVPKFKSSMDQSMECGLVAGKLLDSFVTLPSSFEAQAQLPVKDNTRVLSSALDIWERRTNQHFLQLFLGGSRGVPRPAERHSLSSVSWVFPEASSRWDTPGTPP
ncbi:hypothetical protein L3Q82_020906 [Scortum barcoo]|uniref:Uncharacterized protein n=1 Tax=Scortum barcoo TaxID=214431 RepID=A0ACB8V9A9_9TELE|nr:hypothetical protein L3Q82_020906 [Scortum barcoo]